MSMRISLISSTDTKFPCDDLLFFVVKPLVRILCQLLMQGENGRKSVPSLIPHASVVSPHMDSETDHVSLLAHATVANVTQAEI